MSTNEKKEKGVLKELQEFYTSSKNFNINCEKPDKKGNYLIYFRIHDYC